LMGIYYENKSENIHEFLLSGVLCHSSSYDICYEESFMLIRHLIMKMRFFVLISERRIVVGQATALFFIIPIFNSLILSNLTPYLSKITVSHLSVLV